MTVFSCTRKDYYDGKTNCSTVATDSGTYVNDDGGGRFLWKTACLLPRETDVNIELRWQLPINVLRSLDYLCCWFWAGFARRVERHLITTYTPSQLHGLLVSFPTDVVLVEAKSFGVWVKWETHNKFDVGVVWHVFGNVIFSTYSDNWYLQYDTMRVKTLEISVHKFRSLTFHACESPWYRTCSTTTSTTIYSCHS